ncbi:hypothetical protein E5288_WYG015110 [Bos mutus]|uniref:Uncharacterized protein n=1 Tax=Bos mutus TaxID=72004 RepID=A0A6B0RKA9_9CETA|nr:hypothetical protein [Bos mutus]
MDGVRPDGHLLASWYLLRLALRGVRAGAAPKKGRRRGAGLRAEVLQRHTCSNSREEQETARIGPGAMASKEEQAVKHRNMEDANQKNEKERWKGSRC